MIHTRIYALFLLAFAAMVFVVWQQGKELTKAQKTTEGVTSIIQPGTVTHIGPTGESVTSQVESKVDKATFNNLKGDEIKQMGKTTGVDLGTVKSIIQSTMRSEFQKTVPVRDTIYKVMTIIKKDTVWKIDSGRVIRWSGKFESGTVLVRKDSALIQTSVVNKLAILQTRDRWKFKHLWPGNWGKRKNRVQLLVFNPNTHVDTLSNLSVIQ